MGLTQKLGTIPLAIQTDSSNNVGIGGAANASYKLAVTGATLNTDTIRILTGANTSDISYAVGKEMSSNNAAFFGWRFNSGGTPYGFISVFGTTGRFSLMPDGGNVGIGTTNPDYPLVIQANSGAAQAVKLLGRSADNISILSFHNNANNTQYGYIAGIPSEFRINSGSGLPITFTNLDTERMRITSGGQLQIKQSGNTFNDGFRIFNTSNNYWGFVAGGDNNLYLGYNSPTASIGVFNSITGIYTATSDINKKKDFEQSTIGLDAVLGLKPTLYRMKTDSETTEKHLGFIAQEVKEFIPQAYSENTNGDSVFIGLTEMPIIAALVKAIQELSAKVTALENK